jgi:hypothetical protein
LVGLLRVEQKLAEVFEELLACFDYLL